MSAELREKIAGKLQRRQDERLAKVEEMRTERELTTGKQENSDYFNANFAKEKLIIEKRLATASSVDKAALTDLFDSLSIAVKTLQGFTAEYALFLTSFEIRKAQDDIDNLQTSIEEKRNEMIPKKKFSFKGRENKSAVEKPKKLKATEIDLTDNASDDLLNFRCGFINQSKTDLELIASEVESKDIGLINLTSCTVRLFGSPNAIHMNNLIDCTILTGPVPGSIFLDNCERSTFIVSCQQLRVHHTTDCKFYLHVTSRAIIEDTTNVGFAPYNWEYSGQAADFAKSKLDRTRNSWNDVDDFNWLASDKASPNWKVIPEMERVTSWEPKPNC